MKKLRPSLFLAFCLLGSFSARSQISPEPMVVGSAGQEFANHGLTLDWTIGEVAVAAWRPAGSAQLLEGFHRGPLLPESAAGVVVFPNPFKTEIWLQYSAAQKALRLELYDLQGRLLRTLTSAPGLATVHLELADVPVAGYVLAVYDPASGRRTTHFILKND
jgi:hypothetical protein